MREARRLGYRPALDGVRGIAIAIVVAFHAFGWPAAGTLGVDLFFVLSGFLITTLLLEEHARSGRIGIRAFYLRRARRLLPALFALLVPFLLIALAAVVFRGSSPSALFLGLGAALTYTSNIVVAADPSAVPAALIHLWSLGAEEQFYIVWPLLLVVLMRRGGIGFVGVVLGAYAVASADSVRPLVCLGRFSYSVYLWLLPLLVAFAGLSRGFGLSTIAAVVAAVVVATGSRHLIELPFLARGREATAKPGRTVPAIAAA